MIFRQSCLDNAEQSGIENSYCLWRVAVVFQTFVYIPEASKLHIQSTLIMIDSVTVDNGKTVIDEERYRYEKTTCLCNDTRNRPQRCGNKLSFVHCQLSDPQGDI